MSMSKATKVEQWRSKVHEVAAHDDGASSACEMISKVSENKDLKPHECGRSTQISASEAQSTVKV